MSSFLFSCSNDNETHNNGLLKKITTYGYTNFGTKILKEKELRIYYTNENKIDYIQVEYFDTFDPKKTTTTKFFYTGDLITSKDRFTGNYTPSDIHNEYFEYDNKNRVVKYKNNDDSARHEYTYEYPTNGNILVTQFDRFGINYFPSHSYEMILDQNLNITGYSNIENTSIFDDKVSAINGIIGLDKIYFINTQGYDTFNMSYSNNKILDYGKDILGLDVQQNYSYKYNANNKPTKKYIENKLYFEYEYY